MTDSVIESRVSVYMCILVGISSFVGDFTISEGESAKDVLRNLNNLLVLGLDCYAVLSGKCRGSNFLGVLARLLRYRKIGHLILENSVRRSKEVKKLQAKSLGNNILKFWMVLVFFLFIGIQGCSLFSGGGTTSSTEGDGQGEPQGPFSKGILQGVAHIAPVNTKAAVLAGIASQLGWENDVTQNTLLRDAAENGDFEEKVEPYLLTLFYKKGFSVLPSVGEGHEFSRIASLWVG